MSDKKISDTLENGLPSVDIDCDSRHHNPNRDLDTLPDGLKHRQHIRLEPTHHSAHGALNTRPDGINDVTEGLRFVIHQDKRRHQGGNSRHNKPDWVGVQSRVQQPLGRSIRAGSHPTRNHGGLLRHPSRRSTRHLHTLLHNATQKITRQHGFKRDSLSKVSSLGHFRRRPSPDIIPNLDSQGDQAKGAGNCFPGDKATHDSSQNGFILDQRAKETP